MIYFFKIFKTNKLKVISYKLTRGMTYVELIVVLSIFTIMMSISLSNYGSFQAKIDIKNLANDIALKIVQAQKDASNGKFKSGASPTWKPSYGVYFNKNSDNKSFVYFADLNNSVTYSPNSFTCTQGVDPECLPPISITKGNTISEVRVFSTSADTTGILYNNSFHITFTRPGLSPRIVDGTVPAEIPTFYYTQITIISPKGNTAYVKVYASGKVQID